MAEKKQPSKARLVFKFLREWAPAIIVVLAVLGGVWQLGQFLATVATKEDIADVVRKENIRDLVTKEVLTLVVAPLEQRLERVEAQLYDIQKILIAGGLARTASIPTLEDVLRGTFSISLQAPEQQRIYWIRFDSIEQAERIPNLWIELEPQERLRLFQDVMKPDMFFWLAPVGSPEASLFPFEEVPEEEKALFWDAISWPDAEISTFWE